MAADTIYVMDEMVVPPGQGEAILKDYLDSYGPGARQRGFVLDRVLVNPPLWTHHAPNTITVSWTVQGAGAYWNTLFQSRNDEALAQWWKEFSTKLISRRRTVHAAAEDLKGLADV